MRRTQPLSFASARNHQRAPFTRRDACVALGASDREPHTDQLAGVESSAPSTTRHPSPSTSTG
jgi:hypothetical protein